MVGSIGRIGQSMGRIGLSSPSMGGGVPYDADAEAYFARLAVQPSTRVKRAVVVNLVQGAKASGLWPHLSDVVIPKVGVANLKSSARPLTAAGTMTEDATGFTGDAASGNFTGMGVLSSITQLALNNTFLGHYTARSDSGQIMQVGRAGTTSTVLTVLQSVSLTGRVNDATSDAVTIADPVGPCTWKRDGASSKKAFLRDALLQTFTTASTATQTVSNATIGRANSNYFKQFSMSWFGGDDGSGNIPTDAMILAWHASVSQFFIDAYGWTLVPAPRVVSISPTGSAVTLPDGASGSVAGKGFTCTGAAIDDDGTFWVCNTGKPSDAPASHNGSIVHLTSDLQFIEEFRVADMTAIPDATILSLQGLDIRPATGHLVAIFKDINAAGATVVGYVHRTGGSKGQIVGTPFVAGDTSNGLTVNTDDDTLFVSGGGTIAERNADTYELIQSFSVSVPGGPDQLKYRPSKGSLLITSGANGVAGTITEISLTNQWNVTYPEATITATGAEAIEGLVVLPNGDWKIFNDRYRHGGLLNYAQDYPSV